jgi:hypothetical protein
MTVSGETINAKVANGVFYCSSELTTYLKDSCNFHNVRGVMVPLDYSNRTVVAQGIVNNTIGTLNSRTGGNLGSIWPDYIFRANCRQNELNSNKTQDGTYTHYDMLKMNNAFDGYGNDQNYLFKNLNGSGTEAPLNIEIMANGGDKLYNIISVSDTSDAERESSDLFFVDKNNVNF